MDVVTNIWMQSLQITPRLLMKKGDSSHMIVWRTNDLCVLHMYVDITVMYNYVQNILHISYIYSITVVHVCMVTSTSLRLYTCTDRSCPLRRTQRDVAQISCCSTWLHENYEEYDLTDFMICSIRLKWKEIFSYFFHSSCSHSINTWIVVHVFVVIYIPSNDL